MWRIGQKWVIAFLSLAAASALLAGGCRQENPGPLNITSDVRSAVDLRKAGERGEGGEFLRAEIEVALDFRKNPSAGLYVRSVPQRVGQFLSEHDTFTLKDLQLLVVGTAEDGQPPVHLRDIADIVVTFTKARTSP